jgi:hypothetical protein
MYATSYMKKIEQKEKIIDAANFSKDHVSWADLKIHTKVFVSMISVVFILANWKEVFFLLWKNYLSIHMLVNLFYPSEIFFKICLLSYIYLKPSAVIINICQISICKTKENKPQQHLLASSSFRHWMICHTFVKIRPYLLSQTFFVL